MAEADLIEMTVVARELGMDTTVAFGLVFAGELRSTTGPTGRIFVTRKALDEYAAIRSSVRRNDERYPHIAAPEATTDTLVSRDDFGPC